MGLIFKKSTAQPAFTVAAAITGTARVGQTLTCTYTVTKARASSVVVRWYRYNRTDGIEPTGETLLGTGTTYVLTGNEVGKYVRAIVTATNPAGVVTSTSSFTAAVVNTETPPEAPTLTSPATISGTVEVGSTLTVSYGFDGETSVAIQWFSALSRGTPREQCTNLGTSSTQALTNAEDGRWIGCDVTASNVAGDYLSTATRVGPVAALSTVAPSIVSPAAISLDEGADGYNEGEYIICDAEFSGHTSPPTFTWYKCDAGKANAEELVGAGVEPIRPLFVSEPNHWRGALFLDQSLGLNVGGKYVYCVATAQNGADPGTTTSESDAVGPIGAIQGTPITQAMVGDGPYYLPLANTTYYLAENIRTTGSGIIANKALQKLNLNGKTLTFDDDTPVGLVNGDFGTGDFTGWDVTNAPDASVFVSSDFKDDFNTAKRFHNPNSCLFSSAIHAEPIVPQYIEQTGITLQRWAWYSFTVQWNEPNNVRITLEVIHDGQVVRSNTMRRAGTAYQGHRPVEVVFQAYHSDPTYDFRITVTGEAGLASNTYVHYAKIARTRAAGVYVSGQHTNGGPKSADAVSIEAGGSGYADGTYTNLLSTRHSGESLPVAANYPTLDVTVSGGVVTAVSISGGKRGYSMRAHDLKLTIPNTLLGGTGSGLIVNVDGYRVGGIISSTGVFQDITNFWYGANVPGLDHTTRFNTGGDGAVIKNGAIVQGADAGSVCYGVYMAGKREVTPNLSMHRVSTTISGYHSYALQQEGGSWNHVIVKDCYVSCMHGANPDRHNYGAAIERVRGTIARTTVLHSGFQGYRSNSDTSPLTIYGCTFRNRSYYTNQSSVPVSGIGTVFHDNLIDNTGDYWGRCIHCRVNGNVEAYNNVLKMQATEYTAEYGGPESEGEHAVQLETSSVGGVVNMHDNVFEAYSSKDLTTAGETHISTCFRYTGIYSGATISFTNNTLRAVASGPGFAAAYWPGDDKTSAIDLPDNTVETNSVLFGTQDNQTARVIRNAISLTALDGNSLRPLMIGFSNTPPAFHTDIDIVDPIMSAEDFATLASGQVWRKPRYGATYEPATRGAYRIKWTTTIATGTPGSAVVIRDAANEIVASGDAGLGGEFTAELQQYYISGATSTNTSNYTVTVNGGTPVAFTADSVQTINAPA